MPPLFETSERTVARAISRLVYGSPFGDERMDAERRILGDAYVGTQPYWSLLPDVGRKGNVDAIAARCATLVRELRDRLLIAGAEASIEDLQLYEDAVVYFLYEGYREQILQTIERGAAGERVPYYAQFRRDVATWLELDALKALPPLGSAHLFACFYQVRRAFHHIFTNIVGRSSAAAKVRETVWQSIFTHDVRRYRRALYSRMAEVSTLITGPTGTGKELVARAIALSRYVPFDEKRERFAGEPAATFVSLNLAALSPTLIESELFGYRKGAFTGAIEDRQGFLESCGDLGTVFLDEIGEVDPSVQVKLLRVMQNRTFQRLGETTTRRFGGKLIAATNRDLAEEIRRGRFREDFYYRLCSDTIATPTLHEQLAGNDDELRHLLRFIAARVAGPEEAERLADDVCTAIRVSPGGAYTWPGNFRELEQCARSVMLRGEYRPASSARVDVDARRRIADAVVAGELSADDLLRNYCTLLYAGMRNYAQVAQRLGIDRRTVKAKVDRKLLESL